MPKPIPVILDTDIGGDIDDTWALYFLLRCPELDLKLVLTNTGDVRYRAALAAKLLEVAGRGDVPVAAGVGDGQAASWDYQRPWAEGFDLAGYKGGFRADGVRALVETVKACREAPTLIAIGTAPNLAAALEEDPGFAGRCKVAGMFGSIKHGLAGAEGAVPENNVVQNIAAAQAAFKAQWRGRVITPLDSCGLVRLEGAAYAAIRDSRDPALQTLMENYRLWSRSGGGGHPEAHSSSLYDTVAVHLAFSEEFLEVEEMGIRVDDEGYTRPDGNALKWRVATGWKDRQGFQDLLVRRLLGGG